MENKPTGMTRRLARFIADFDAAKIPPAAFEHAKIALMDWLGVTIAGKDEPLVDKLLGYADLMGGKGQATILGRGVKKSVAQAALINGAASHALDYDDTMLYFSGHPTVTIMPALLALSEWKRKSGLDFLTSYIIGLKAGVTIASCAGAGHYAAGWHSTCTMGHPSSAAACSRLLGLDEQQTVHALGIACTQASGLKRVFGTMCKPFHAGVAAEAGVSAALLGSEGFTSAEDILEGPNGLFQAMKGEVKEHYLNTLGDTWQIESLAQKYHASCHYTHSPIEAAQSVMKEKGLSVRDIKSIKVYASAMGIAMAGKTEVRTGLEGKFSIYYCVANALVRGDTSLTAFSDDRVADPRVKDLMGKISLHPDPKITNLEARVEVETTSGGTFTAFSDIMNEIPELDLKRERIKTKFRQLCEPLLGEQKTSQLIEAISGTEKMKHMNSLVRML